MCQADKVILKSCIQCTGNIDCAHFIWKSNYQQNGKSLYKTTKATCALQSYNWLLWVKSHHLIKTDRFWIIVRQKKYIYNYMFTVCRLTLIFGPNPNFFYGTYRRKLFKYLIFVFQCSFCGASEAERHLGITLSVVCLSVCLSVCPSVTLLVCL